MSAWQGWISFPHSNMQSPECHQLFIKQGAAHNLTSGSHSQRIQTDFLPFSMMASHLCLAGTDHFSSQQPIHAAVAGSSRNAQIFAVRGFSNSPRRCPSMHVHRMPLVVCSVKEVCRSTRYESSVQCPENWYPNWLGNAGMQSGWQHASQSTESEDKKLIAIILPWP